MKHAAALTRKLTILFPDQLSHIKDKGNRALKGFKERTDKEKMQSMGDEGVDNYIRLWKQEEELKKKKASKYPKW
jgi:hypothetical protein